MCGASLFNHSSVMILMTRQTSRTIILMVVVCVEQSRHLSEKILIILVPRMSHSYVVIMYDCFGC